MFTKMKIVFMSIVISFFSFSYSSRVNLNILQDTRGGKRDINLGISSELREEFLNRLNQVNADLRELETTKSDFQSKSVLGTREKCTLSMEKLKELKISIDNALSSNRQANSINCDLNDHNPAGNCNELIKVIQCGVNELQNGFLRAANNESNEEIIKIKNTFDELLAKYKKFFEDEKLTLSQDYELKIEKLMRDMQSLQSLINSLQEDLKNKLPEVLAYKIMRGETTEALNEFMNAINSNIDSSYLIDNTIDKSYNIQYIEKILKFIKSLPTHDYNARGYEKLFDKMRSNGDENSPKMIMFYDTVMLNMRNVGYQDLKNKLTTHHNKVINALGSRMRNNDCEQIKNFAKEYTINRGYLETLVKEGYANNVNNAENILNCISSMPSVEDHITTLSALYEEIRRNNHLGTSQLMVLAYKTKSLLETLDYSSVHYFFIQKIDDLRASLPNAVRGIIWRGNRCTIKNKRLNQYLFASSLKYDNNRRRVFTWRPGGNVVQRYWKFIPLDSGKKFQIQNTYYNEYLYADNNEYAFDNNGRNIFTWIPGTGISQGDWILQPVSSSQIFDENFLLKNTYHPEYLYGADNSFYDKDRQRVFTWRHGGSVINSGKWEIHC